MIPFRDMRFSIYLCKVYRNYKETMIVFKNKDESIQKEFVKSGRSTHSSFVCKLTLPLLKLVGSIIVSRVSSKNQNRMTEINHLIWLSTVDKSLCMGGQG